MGTQLSFLNFEGRVNTRYRVTDPVTSREAAARSTVKAWTDLDRLVDAVRRWPGRSTKQLAVLIPMDRHAAGRRAADAKRSGDIEVRYVSGLVKDGNELRASDGDLALWPVEKL